MTGFSGFPAFAPQVGEIRAVRTFRVGADGALLPLFDARPWVDGPNQAACRFAGVTHDAHDRVPVEACSCGFYAYADEDAATEYPLARHVLAVVACWGQVVAGTRGLRCEFARIEAVWLGAAVPRDLAAAVRRRYPSAGFVASRSELVGGHPPDVLDCYERAPRVAAARWATRVCVVGLLALGAVPPGWLAAHSLGRWAWAAAIVALLGAAVVAGGGRGRGELGQRRRQVRCLAVAVWAFAPLDGRAGLLVLQVPLALLAVLIFAHRRGDVRRARTFPSPPPP